MIGAPANPEQKDYDLLVIGGGIYGVMLTLQAARRGKSVALLESRDFGGETSFNSLRIVHGGLRYLQSADLIRFFESVRERRWLLSHFADLVSPLPCLMPLYATGLRRNSVMRLALLANDCLSATRNAGVPKSNHIRNGKVVSAAETLQSMPLFDSAGLRGGALWYDAAMDDSQRLIIEALRWASALGAVPFNYMAVRTLLTGNNRVTGVVAEDLKTGSEQTLRAPVVINAAGPWADALGKSLASSGSTFFQPSLAWNMWINRPAPAECAFTLTAPRHDAATYFVRPWKGRMLVGTGHAPWAGSLEAPLPSREQLVGMLEDLNAASPGLDLAMDDIRHVFSGLLPAQEEGSANLAVRPAVVNHADDGGPAGFFSVSGVKFTTAHFVAKSILDKVFGKYNGEAREPAVRPASATGWSVASQSLDQPQQRMSYMATLKDIVSTESVFRLTDLVFRRTDLWEDRAAVENLLPDLPALFDWNQERRDEEVGFLREAMQPRQFH